MTSVSPVKSPPERRKRSRPASRRIQMSWQNGLAFITGRGHLRAVSHSPTASGGSPMAEVAR
jgi:hypothetical protein